jgi:hypothetical protein
VTERVRQLWTAVLVQAFEDLEHEIYGSYWHNQAVAFFFGSGEWPASRIEICDFLGLDPAGLRRPALRIINKRRLERGLPPLRTETPRPRLPVQRAPSVAADRSPLPLPRLVAIPAPDPPVKPRRSWRTRYVFNPFDPYRRLPSEARADAAD